ncbi:MAG: thioredoxin family protein [Anaerolineaceae bacterium]
MVLSNFRKKKSESSECCGPIDEVSFVNAVNARSEGPSVKVLGSGCAKCNQLEAATVAALEQLGMDTAIDHVRDFAQIASYGVMSTPALVVDGKVVSYGKVLKTEEVVAILKKARG